MSKTNIIIFILFIFVVGIILGSYISLPQQKVNSQIIYEKLQSQGFLVTQNYIFEQKIEIDNTSGQTWKDIFWGQKIQANALMKVNLGVDLQQLTENDIKLTKNKLTIKLPQIQIHSTELISDINLENQQGILKLLLDRDDGYNQALSLLKENAELSAKDAKIIAETRLSTTNEINRLLNLITTDKEIIIEFTS
jgi:hypothetical protein